MRIPLHLNVCLLNFHLSSAVILMLVYFRLAGSSCVTLFCTVLNLRSLKLDVFANRSFHLVKIRSRVVGLVISRANSIRNILGCGDCEAVISWIFMGYVSNTLVLISSHVAAEYGGLTWHNSAGWMVRIGLFYDGPVEAILRLWLDQEHALSTLLVWAVLVIRLGHNKLVVGLLLLHNLSTCSNFDLSLLI